MQIEIVDPHITDELVNPIRNFLRGRRAIGKYAYLLDEFSEEQIVFTFSGQASGLLPQKIFSLLPNVIKKILIIIEKKIFKYFYKRFNNPDKSSQNIKIYILRNVCDIQIDRINNDLRKGRTIFGLCSHAHLIKQKLLKFDRNLLLLCDKELNALEPFSSFKCYHLPLIAAERFTSRTNWVDRSSKVLALGTVHRFTEKMPGFVAVGNNFYTLHPSRYDVLNNGLDEIFTKNFSVVNSGENFINKQKSYMSIDLVSLYNQYRYGFVGSDALGIAANGLFEGMACGCEMFLEAKTADKLGFLNGKHVWTFDGSAKNLMERYVDITFNSRRLKYDPVSIAHEWNLTSRQALSNTFFGTDLRD